MANESQCVFFNISTACLMSKWIRAGEKMIEALFAVADYFSPSVIFLDEVDLLLYTRIAEDKSVSRNMFAQFHHEFDRVSRSRLIVPGNCPYLLYLQVSMDHSKNVLVMAASEKPFELDDVALRYVFL